MKVSFIVPAYNIELYLSDCIEGILKQTYTNWELIIINDGSTDNTSQICDIYASDDSRIKVIHQKNMGVVIARNNGFKAAEGDWIMYLDGDDWIELKTCEILLQKARLFNYPDIIFFNNIQEVNGKQIRGKTGWRQDVDEFLYQNDNCEKLAYNTLIYKSGIATSYCKLIRKDFAKEFNLIHNKKVRSVFDGVEFSLRAFSYASSCLYLNEHFYHYRYIENSLSKKSDESNVLYMVRGAKEILSFIKQQNYDKEFVQALYQRITYALIAVAMSTYFHPNNQDKVLLQIKKFNSVITQNPIIRESIKKVQLYPFDIKRKITILLIKYKIHIFLPLISNLKMNLFKKGYFKY